MNIMERSDLELESINSVKEKEKIQIILSVLGLLLVVFTLVTKIWFPPKAFIERNIYLILSFLILCFVQFLKYKGSKRILIGLATILAISGSIYIIIFSGTIRDNYFQATNADFYSLVLYFIGIFILMQDNTGGKIISILGSITLLYLFLGRYIPASSSFTLPALNIRQIATMVYTDIDQGAFGTFMAVMARILSIFLMFSSLLVATGLGDVIRSISMLAAGKTKGGPAKVAVISSALFGMLSGSPVSNVAATGSFTIPLMKSIGYEPKTAAAVETIASSGGGITPPIMGISAFIMAEILGIPYVQIIVFAIVPAALWYFSTFIYVHFSAIVQNVQAWAPQRDDLIKDFKQKGLLLVSVFVLIGTLIIIRVPEVAALYSVISLFIISSLRKETRLIWSRMQNFLISYAKVYAGLAILNTMLGIFTGALLSTGTHTNLIHSVMGGVTSWYVVAFIVFVLCLIFGMLVPPFVAYITVVIVAAPTLTTFGFSLPVVHMFVLYCCALAPITPPVALAAYTAASIAGADAIQVAKEASIKAAPLWIIPFILLKYSVFFGMDTNFIQVILWTVMLMIGIFIFTLSVHRYAFGKIPLKWSLWLMILAVGIVQPISQNVSILFSVLAIGSLIILYIFNRKQYA